MKSIFFVTLPWVLSEASQKLQQVRRARDAFHHQVRKLRPDEEPKERVKFFDAPRIELEHFHKLAQTLIHGLPRVLQFLDGPLREAFDLDGRHCVSTDADDDSEVRIKKRGGRQHRL